MRTLGTITAAATSATSNKTTGTPFTLPKRGSLFVVPAGAVAVESGSLTTPPVATAGSFPVANAAAQEIRLDHTCDDEQVISVYNAAGAPVNVLVYWSP